MIEYVRDWRYERKFIISGVERKHIETIIRLHPAMFSEIHHERAVNNIYLDTFTLSNYFDNVDGKSQRLKVRIRWYGELFGPICRPVLELKIKSGFLGGKLSYPLPSIELNRDLTINSLWKAINEVTIPEEIKFNLNSLKLSLLNCYVRKYFQSADKKFRLTLDSNLRYYHLAPHNNTFLNRYDDTRNILELKYDATADSDAARITNHFPFRLTKSSKYVMGIERSHL